jgi:hypothetical protein
MNISLDSNNDIAMVNGGLPLVTGIEEIRQSLTHRLSFFQADWFLDLDLGIPYFQTIFQKATEVSQVEGIYLDVIANTPGVLDITSFNLSINSATRVLSMDFTVNTSDGVLDYTFSNEV